MALSINFIDSLQRYIIFKYVCYRLISFFHHFFFYLFLNFVEIHFHYLNKYEVFATIVEVPYSQNIHGSNLHTGCSLQYFVECKMLG
jgi:hypothetical protein